MLQYRREVIVHEDLYTHSDPFTLFWFLFGSYLYIWSFCGTNAVQVLYKAWNKC